MGTTPPLEDDAYFALCIWDEARGESFMGQRAVARVLLNRTALKYSSDGTPRGTVLRPNQFSGFYFDMVNGRYQRVCHDMEAADIRAHQMWQAHGKDVKRSDARLALRDELGGIHNDANPDLPTDTVLYYNPAVVKSPPKWATPEKFIKVIGHHAFYRA